MKIRKGERVIEVSPKAFHLLYEEQGYVEATDAVGDSDRNLQKMKVDALRELAMENGIEGYEKMKKAELLDALERGGKEDVGSEERGENEEYL